MITEQEARADMVRIGRLLYEKDFICASDGNISVRVAPNRILITPSGLHKGFLHDSDMVVVDANGRSIPPYTKHKATSELPMHLEAYRLRPDIHAVVHAHPPITVALSIAEAKLTEYILPEVIVFLGLIPVTDYATPSSDENAQAIRQHIRTHDGLILKRHGSLTVGNSPMQAFMRLETLEQNARMLSRLLAINAEEKATMHPIDTQKLLQMRQKMGLAHVGETAVFTRHIIRQLVRQTLEKQLNKWTN